MAIEFTCEIAENEFPESLKEHIIKIRLNKTVSHNQIKSQITLARIVDDIIQLLIRLNKMATTIHLFISAQSTLVFSLGRRYQDGMIGNIQVHNYDAKDKKYLWAFEIENNEIESWQKLKSVLTHEMINSITPITSLAHAIKRYLKNDDELLDKLEINNELISDIVENADIIENRGKGLLEFIDNYRTISKLPKPKFETIEIREFLHKIVQLFDNVVKEKNINIIINVNPENLSLLADKSMIEQVIINLMKNSIEALTNISNPRIELNSFIDENQKIKIHVIDNGNGISKEIIEDVFIPFYTTKQQGSGVGLSLSRQIMKLHKGSININSEPKIQTKVILVF